MSEIRDIAKPCGLYPETRGSRCYFRGHGRRWRVNNAGQFQMGDDNFDRWANSVAASVHCPSNIKELRAAIKQMLPAPPEA